MVQFNQTHWTATKNDSTTELAFIETIPDRWRVVHYIDRQMKSFMPLYGKFFPSEAALLAEVRRLGYELRKKLNW
jgi:hypothetical protein